MIESDTIKLLRECDAGVKMGVASIDEVLDSVADNRFQQRLRTCKQKHEELDRRIQALLDQYHDEGKNPDPIAKGMSWMRTNWKLRVDGSDGAIAGVMTDGCNMGVKSLHKYLNQYEAADEASKNIAKELIGLEEDLTADISRYL